MSTGHPFFARGPVVIASGCCSPRPDWEEIRELVTDSYRVLAPKKLTALLD